MLSPRSPVRLRRTMQIGADQSYVLGLFNTSNTDGNGIVSIDLSSLLTSPASVSAAVNAAKPVAPTPPWNATETTAQASAAVQSALAGHSLVDLNAAKLDLPGASADYKKLFALYQGLNTLQDLAQQAQRQGNDGAGQGADLEGLRERPRRDPEIRRGHRPSINCGWRTARSPASRPPSSWSRRRRPPTPPRPSPRRRRTLSRPIRAT